jgi:hypothetical protein
MYIVDHFIQIIQTEMVFHPDLVVLTGNTITMMYGHLTLPLETGLSCNVSGSFHHPEKVMQLH